MNSIILFGFKYHIRGKKMNRYVCHLQHQDAIILNATDDEEAAWLGLAHARIEGTQLKDVQLIEE